MAPADALNIEVVFCPGPGRVDTVSLSLPAGATVAQALAASGIAERHGLPADGLRLGVWCKPREAHSVLRERDRVEIYRALTVDPKEARRQRYQQHKASLAARPQRPGPAQRKTGG
jgi:putative ubiquitin-RnfH superfamily antitoxin RatB of RatAB toxin-antitoxin module